MLFKFLLFFAVFLNAEETCNQVVNHKYFTICYDYELKGARSVSYVLTKTEELNIKERPRFYDDLELPKRYRSTYSDYTRNEYSMDRGHMAEDASFDYSKESLNAIYVMSNIVPQNSDLNQNLEGWAGVEKLGRSLAVKLGSINVLNIIKYSDNPVRMGRNKVAIPSAFIKIYHRENFKKCFYFKNESIGNRRLTDFEVDCENLNRY